MLAQLEESNLSQMRESDELRSNIRELETARQEARRDNQQLQNQVCFLTELFVFFFLCNTSIVLMSIIQVYFQLYFIVEES